MQFTCKVTIDAPRDVVVKYWTSKEHLPKWQDGFQYIKALEGEEGAAGSTAEIFYQQGKRDILLHETIIKNALPERFKAEYVHEVMTNTMTTEFIALDAQKTVYQSEIHYTQFKGLMLKIMAKLFPGMFKKQVMKWMVQFKTMVEGELRSRYEQ